MGGSTGDWREAGIAAQTADATAALEAVRAAGGPEPIGLFGHSQGGWVVIEAAARGAAAAFVITNGGPGVSPAVQDRFALANSARRSGRPPDGVERVLARYDLTLELLREGVSVADAAARLGPADGPELDDYGAADDAEWELQRLLVDHDPRPALRGLAVPVLALFGADDEITPVAVSVEAFRAEVRPSSSPSRSCPAATTGSRPGSPSGWWPATATPSWASSPRRSPGSRAPEPAAPRRPGAAHRVLGAHRPPRRGAVLWASSTEGSSAGGDSREQG